MDLGFYKSVWRQITRPWVLVSLIICTLRALHAQSIEWSGYLQTDNRISQHGAHDFSWQEYRLDLTAGMKPSDRIKFYGEMWFRSFGFPTTMNTADLQANGKISACDFELREAYLDLSGNLLRNLDLRFGRQRIAWGTADKLNPTDNLNPDDLEDIWDFGRHLSSNGVKASYYEKNLTFTGVFLPIFTPAVLPSTKWSSVLMPAIELPPGLTQGSINDSIIMPDPNPQQSSIYGMKIAKNIFNYDVSLSYIYGRDDLPMARKIAFIPTSSGSVDIASELIFPRMQIFGLDFSGEIAGFGVWAEGALHIPEQVTMTIDMSALGMGQTDSVALADDPYAKYVLGADYTFKKSVYLNYQYLHGFFHERGADNLEDYVMLGLEWKLFDERLKLMPLNGGLEIKDFNDIAENYAVILSPEIAYFPVDNAELNFGVHWIEGKSTTMFGKAKDNDDVYFKIKYSF